MESFGNGFVEVLSTPQGCDVHNRRWSKAQPPDYRHTLSKVPQGRDYQPALNNLALAGLCCWGLSIRRLRFATPPVMHITPHAGLRKMSFDKFILFRVCFSRSPL
jgi:hypothetical protein